MSVHEPTEEPKDFLLDIAKFNDGDMDIAEFVERHPQPAAHRAGEMYTNIHDDVYSTPPTGKVREGTSDELMAAIRAGYDIDFTGHSVEIFHKSRIVVIKPTDLISVTNAQPPAGEVVEAILIKYNGGQPNRHIAEALQAIEAHYDAKFEAANEIECPPDSSAEVKHGWIDHRTDARIAWYDRGSKS